MICFENRPFYIETVTPIPKDIVLVVDRSGSMGEVVGGETLMDIAIGAARTVVNTLSINDRVRGYFLCIRCWCMYINLC